IIAQQRKPESPDEARARQRVERGREASPAARNAAPVREPEPIKPTPPPARVEVVATKPAPPTPPPEPPKPPELPAPPVPLPEPAATEGETHRQILQELRHQRALRADFSYFKVLAIVFQMIALLCVLGGLWMGRESQDVFLRWIATGILVQLITITM